MVLLYTVPVAPTWHFRVNTLRVAGNEKEAEVIYTVFAPEGKGNCCLFLRCNDLMLNFYLNSNPFSFPSCLLSL